MSKEPLNLSIDENMKRRAKEIARKRGISVSRFFERLIEQQNDADIFEPTPGSAAYNIATAIPESKKVDDYDYKKLKRKALEKKYGDK